MNTKNGTALAAVETPSTDETLSVAIADEANIVFTTKNGRTISQIDEDELDTDIYFQFQAMSVKSKSRPEESMRWLILKLFLIDGNPLTIDHLTEKPPIGIGFKAANRLGNITAALLKELPSPKISSTSDALADGDSTTGDS
ncbi:MAG TPA: hypothetical protein V6C88_04925 [Chroococcidiopsis sp.]